MKNSTVDLSEVDVIDQHCHMFLDEAKSIDWSMLVRVMSLEAYNPDFVVPEKIVEGFLRSDSGTPSYNSENRYYHDVFDRSVDAGSTSLMFLESLQAMGKFLGCESKLKTVLSKRNERSSDLRKYASDLYGDAKLKTLILSDYRFRSTIGSPIPTKNKVVIHTLMFSILDKSKLFEEALTQFETELEEYIRKKGFIGMKSMIAYGGIRRGTGLNIGNPDESIVKEEFDYYKQVQGKLDDNDKIKNLEDFFTRVALQIAVKLDVPFEFHTGIGDLDVVTDRCNPMLLGNLLKDENLRKAKVILLHGSYPYTGEAGWMAHFFPNVYLDCSILFFTHHRSAVKKVEEALEMSPYSKLLYSSDGGVLPETHWFGAVNAKRAMSEVMSHLVESESLNESEAEDLAERFFHGNAEKLFHLN